VAEAWRTLRVRDLVETHRRGGTVVREEILTETPFPGWAAIDLLQSSPDRTLQPDLAPALVQALRRPGVNEWGREPMVSNLLEAVASDWPFPAQAWTTAGGGTEGLWLAARAASRPGRPLAVEEPATPGLLANLEDLGIEALGIPVDAEGPEPGALAAALEAGATALIHQPGGPYSTWHVLTEERARELAQVLEVTDAVVVEDDSLGPLSPVEVTSVGRHLPERTLRVLSFCRSYGLDLRTSVLGGARELVARAEAARSGGVASNSRILQHALAALLVDDRARATVAEAAERYTERQDLARRALVAAGLQVHAGPGSRVVWVEVPDADAAALSLAAHGVLVDVSATSFVTPPEVELIRLSTSQVPRDPQRLSELAGLLARAAQGKLHVTFS
jgi:DNA-binding transcriptional MocR family regulator